MGITITRLMRKSCRDLSRQVGLRGWRRTHFLWFSVHFFYIWVKMSLIARILKNFVISIKGVWQLKGGIAECKSYRKKTLHSKMVIFKNLFFSFMSAQKFSHSVSSSHNKDVKQQCLEFCNNGSCNQVRSSLFQNLCLFTSVHAWTQWIENF